MTVYIKKISASQSNASVTFDPKVNYVIIKNVGTNPCYINFNAAATTSLFKLNAQDELSVGLIDIETIQAICDTGLTTTLSVLGTKGYWL